ncbi:ABC transporter ATP-binding protein [Thermosulfurimonas marina]|uniref:ABC transporter ATP-binding protein n=1 Tax=Thermosulfurimonas marina TaxID=2047767 RepID=A0A6H1WTJ0_9BACT|nr:ABC transporter ATP-binding protein [Thermosulfurimonas marina]QJA06527.1 ABC transporter ATP-binding protein [Thermosulfurimonas marina]
MIQLELRGVSKSYLRGRVPALRKVDLALPRGKFLAVLGPSGCGKSTLLRLVAGLEEPDRGEIFIAGRRVDGVPPARRNVAMVFQNYALYPHFTVYQNIALGLKLRGFPRQEIDRRVREVARLLGLEDLLERYPRELSGGQQQRTALARALVREPEVFLLDEPLSNLDAQIREETRSELKRLFRRLEATVLYVTHDQIEALTMADLVAVMESGEIRQLGPPEEVYHRPAHRFVARFVGLPRINFFKGHLEDGIFTSEEGDLRFPLEVSYQGPIEVGLRPEDLRPGKGEITLKGKVVLVEPLGPQKVLFLRTGSREIRALVPEDFPVSLGQELEFHGEPRNLHLFDPVTGKRLRT